MAVKLKTPIEKHIYFDSKINKEREVFETIESSIGFDNFQFANRIKDRLSELGLEPSELAKSIYISKERMKSLLSGKTKFEYSEINTISKRLGF